MKNLKDSENLVGHFYPSSLLLFAEKTVGLILLLFLNHSNLHTSLYLLLDIGIIYNYFLKTAC